MKTVERIAWVLVFAGLALKYFNSDAGGMLLVLSLSAVAVLYYPLGFMLFNGLTFKDMTSSRVLKQFSIAGAGGSVLLGIAFAVLAIGILFRVQLWPLSGELLLAGSLGALLLLGVRAVFYFRTPDASSKGMLIRGAFVVGTALTVYFIPYNTLVDINYRNYPDYARLVKEYHADPTNEALKKQMDEMNQAMWEEQVNGK